MLVPLDTESPSHFYKILRMGNAFSGSKLKRMLHVRKLCRETVITGNLEYVVEC
jgi:hypothetical protein